MTHKGMYRFKRLLYGANVGFECFQKQVEQVLAGIDNVINISDDITVYGSTIQEHDATLRKVLDRIRDYGLTLNLKKCKFRVTEIVFAGYKVSANGISLEESRVQTIMEMPEPTNATEVRSFLGMVNYCNKFIPDYSTISAPLRELTKKNTRFVFRATTTRSLRHVEAMSRQCGCHGVLQPKCNNKADCRCEPSRSWSNPCTRTRRQKLQTDYVWVLCTISRPEEIQPDRTRRVGSTMGM